MERVKWTGTDLNIHLRNISRGKKVSLASYPEEINFHPNLECLFNRIAVQTDVHKKEIATVLACWNPKNYNARVRIHSVIDESDPACWIIAAPLIIGGSNSIPNQLINETSENLTKWGLSKEIACMHSHPSRRNGGTTFFSLDDLYCSIRDKVPAEFLIADGYNLLLLRSYQSQSVTGHLMQLEQEEAVQYWSQVMPNNIQGTNLRITREYHLAFYRGEVNQPLTRLYPPIT